jgi:hypothetical protein
MKDRASTGLERDVIRSLGRLFLGTARDEDVLPLLGQPLDWAHLLDSSSKEGMAGVLALQLERLARHHDLDLPSEPFSDELRKVFMRTGGFLAQLSSLRSALQKQGIRVIVLKGGALIQTAYQRQLGLRPLSDIDLLVKSSDLPLVQQAVSEQGLHSGSPSVGLFRKGPVAFDLHSDLINSDRIRRRALAFRFDAGSLWAHARPLDEQDDSLLVLSPAHQFLHLAVHGLKHSFSRLIWLVDLALVWRYVEWEELLETSAETGTLRPVAYGLEGIHRLLGEKIPEKVWDALPRLNRVERAFMDAVVRRRASEPAGELLVAFSIPSLFGRLGYLWEFAFPRPKILAEVFPTSSSRWFYARRIGQLAHGFRPSAKELR